MTRQAHMECAVGVRLAICAVIDAQDARNGRLHLCGTPDEAQHAQGATVFLVDSPSSHRLPRPTSCPALP